MSVQELSLPDVPIMMTLLDERPSGKLCVSYQKQTVVDAVDEIKATTQRIPNLDIAKVSERIVHVWIDTATAGFVHQFSKLCLYFIHGYS